MRAENLKIDETPAFRLLLGKNGLKLISPVAERSRRYRNFLLLSESALPSTILAMKRLIGTIISLVAVCLCPVFSVRAQSPPTTIKFDLSGDGQRETIVLDREKEPALSVWRGKKLLWQGVHKRWQPWKIMIADVDGDGRSEIIVGVYKATHYFPKPHNCLFIYGWEGESLSPKWLGSTLSKPFTDFTFADLNHDGHQELIAIETTREGKQSVGVYSWNGFGFTLDWQRGAWQSARLIIDNPGGVIVEADGERIALRQE